MKEKLGFLIMVALVFVLVAQKTASQIAPIGETGTNANAQVRAAEATTAIESLMKAASDNPRGAFTVESQITNSDRAVRLRSAEALAQQRRAIVAQMIGILESTDSNSVKSDVAIVLGEYRAAEAVPFLVKNLELEDVPQSLQNPGFLSKDVLDAAFAPVTAALVKIGIPAVPSLLNRILQTDDTKTRVKCLRICRLIEGEDVTQFRLNGLFEKAADRKQKDRIESALDALKKSAQEK